jgi:hypothetical protein
MFRLIHTAGWTFVLTSLAGCVVTNPFQAPKEEPPTGFAQKIEAAWEGRIMTTQDIVNQGAPLKGIAGRLYLFGPDGFPLVGDGTAIVDLCDVTPETTGGQPKLLERWEIDRETLRKLAKKDMIGWGYTLFLPWSTCRPEINRVQLQVRYAPDKALPLFSSPSVVTLHTQMPPVTITTRQVPVAPPAAAQATAAQATAAVPAALSPVLVVPGDPRPATALTPAPPPNADRLLTPATLDRQ